MKTGVIILLIILGVAFASAVAFTPQGDIELKGRFNIFNIVNSNQTGNYTNYDTIFATNLNVSSPPVECPSDTFMTQFFGSSSTCESIVNIPNGGVAQFDNLSVSDTISGNVTWVGTIHIVGNLTISDN